MKSDTPLNSLENELQFAKQLAIAAGEILLKNFKCASGIELKNDGTLVSNVDKEVSDLLDKELKAAFPNYAVLDEERGANLSRGNFDYCWLLDPLDGTRDYLMGKDGYSFLMGLCFRNRPVLGLAYKPQLKELVYATLNGGAYLERDGQRSALSTADTNDISVLVSNSIPSSKAEIMLKAIGAETITPSAGSYKIVEVAKGTHNVFLCPPGHNMNYWDVCGPGLILSEAGGSITDIQGQNLNYSGDSYSFKQGLIATNGRLHSDLIKKLSGKLDVLLST